MAWSVRVDVAFASGLTGAPTWTNISTYVRRAVTRRGRKSELDRFETGTATLLLDNRDARFTPGNGSSPYSPNVLPMKRARIVVVVGGTDYEVFRGYVEPGWPPDWPSGTKDSVVQVDLVDGFSLWGLYEFDVTAFPAETTGARITRLANAASVPLGTLSTGLSTCAAEPEFQGSALGHAQDAADTEDGQLYMSRDGVLMFRDRQWRYFNKRTSAATYGDQAGEIRYVDAKAQHGIRLINHARVTPKDGDAQVASDAASIAAYGRRSVAKSLLSSEPGFALDVAGHLVGRGKNPRLEIPGLELDADIAGSDQVKQASFDVGDRITVMRRPPGGFVIQQDMFIEGVSHDLTAKRWRTSWDLSGPADDTAYWELGDATRGVLGSTTRLGY